MKYTIIDTPWNTLGKVNCLLDQGIDTVVRYYCHNNSNQHPEKKLGLSEAKELSKMGINIMVVYQNVQNKGVYFSNASGLNAGLDAFHWAKHIIGQPLGTAIYFSIDYDATMSDLNQLIVPYFQGVKKSIKETYEIGAYGSGMVVNELKSRGLINYRWLSESTGFIGTKKALENGDYELRQILTKGNNLCELDCDFNLKRDNDTKIGSFILKN
ncbi:MULTISPECIES: DUF1906 domain-containing protein [Flavobacteriaceae]|uniref:DUF1906 domain-containing protein n=1 Tax=Flavobacteriaceae TaxID=49546 RepID=UPI0014915386|nr:MULTISPECIES: DUF1906 domain-containing protein [Allomuricauda]MDC6364886.1 DUF1906 domain-containing protein [Muricauda sp. AC10]